MYVRLTPLSCESRLTLHRLYISCMPSWSMAKLRSSAQWRPPKSRSHLHEALAVYVAADCERLLALVVKTWCYEAGKATSWKAYEGGQQEVYPGGPVRVPLWK